MSGPLGWIPGELDSLKGNSLYNRIRTISSAQGAWLTVDGRDVLNFCSNNYLGLANHPALVEAAQRAAARFGVGPAAVRSIAGTLTLHDELERRLAAFKGSPAVLTFQSGFCANLAAVPALVGAEDAVFSDELNHASIIDACRLSGAKVIRYAHADPADLEAKLAGARAAHRRALIVTDGVFSMDGDIAPLEEIAVRAARFEAALMVDDAHGEGVLGRGGRGIVDHFGLHGRVDVEVGTLSKAFGVVGGLVAGGPPLVDWLRQRARPFLFSSAVPAPDAAACLAALDLLEHSSERVDALWENARFFQARLRDAGFDLGRTQTPITPVLLGEADRAREFSRRLFEQGVFAMALGYPTVPKGKARIRVMLSAAHTRSDLERGLSAFEQVGREMRAI